MKTTRCTGIPICVTQMTHIFTKMYKISLKMILFDKNNFMNVNLNASQLFITKYEYCFILF